MILQLAPEAAEPLGARPGLQQAGDRGDAAVAEGEAMREPVTTISPAGCSGCADAVLPAWDSTTGSCVAGAAAVGAGASVAGWACAAAGAGAVCAMAGSASEDTATSSVEASRLRR